jgi:hypothetical protein
MSRATEMLCSLKVLRHIEATDGLHAGSLVEPGMVHGILAWSKDRESGDIKLAVSDENGEVAYNVGTRTTDDWSTYFKMQSPSGERLINPYDFRVILNSFKDM